MNCVKVFVGLDYHQSSVQVCVLDEHGEQLINRICCNDATEIISSVGSQLPRCLPRSRRVLGPLI